jgi:hypothetical protein
MAPQNYSPSAAVRLAQYQIFNKLCVAYMRSKDTSFLRAVDLRKELDIRERVFAEALQILRHGDPLVVEVIESEGETYLRLGVSSRYNCDWPRGKSSLSYNVPRVFIIPQPGKPRMSQVTIWRPLSKFSLRDELGL